MRSGRENVEERLDLCGRLEEEQTEAEAGAAAGGERAEAGPRSAQWRCDTVSDRGIGTEHRDRSDQAVSEAEGVRCEGEW